VKAAWLGAGALALTVLGWGEWEHWRGSKRALGTAAAPAGGAEAVVVLGYRNRGERANVVNRWRVRAGLRSVESDSPDARLVFCGGPTASRRPEAEMMAAYARDSCHHRGVVLTETASQTTWQNITNVIPLIEDADRIKIVSHSLHAEKARTYLWQQRPDLAARLAHGEDYRFGEWILIKPLLALLRRPKLQPGGGSSLMR
jgi:uncharacterized SAM-binding protein YcdF (DUF218 family)